MPSTFMRGTNTSSAIVNRGVNRKGAGHSFLLSQIKHSCPLSSHHLCLFGPFLVHIDPDFTWAIGLSQWLTTMLSQLVYEHSELLSTTREISRLNCAFFSCLIMAIRCVVICWPGSLVCPFCWKVKGWGESWRYLSELLASICLIVLKTTLRLSDHRFRENAYPFKGIVLFVCFNKGYWTTAPTRKVPYFVRFKVKAF